MEETEAYLTPYQTSYLSKIKHLIWKIYFNLSTIQVFRISFQAVLGNHLNLIIHNNFFKKETQLFYQKRPTKKQSHEEAIIIP